MDEAEPSWSIRDLAELAGTTVRTIHYYISEGLLPPPVGTTRNASYAPTHLARLRVIAALRDEGLALANIRQRLAPLSDEQALEVARALDEHLSKTGETPLTTLGLIEAALARHNVADREEREAAPPVRLANMAIMEPRELFHQLTDMAEPEPSRGSAGDYLNRVLRKPEVSRTSSAVPLPRPPPRKPQESERPEAWYHFRIEDGVELRVREDRYRESKGRMRAVIDTLRTTLRRYGMSQPDKCDE
ncbi:MAG: MerR family transcriptional regulator [Chloroflexota bacterium]|nr:MerR family transcriptional regulator [Chloroflexota bacterium]